ncbi:MAG: flagellar motor protein MotA [Hyphomicrobiaceae bacterium]
MARKRGPEKALTLHRSLSTPAVYLLRMVVFLALVGLIAAILIPTLKAAFMANPALNGLILFTLGVGIIYAFWQCLRLYPEIRWVNAFRIADPGLAIGHRPVLLAPMATMLRDRTGALSLSTASMRSIMDSIASRLDEARDTGRYMVGVLVFLGLLGTFWGLLDTIQSVGKTIAALDTKVADSAILFDDLKTGLAAPLRGMGTAFASSLFGLSGSLVLGFLELQANQSHNRFYNELEEWLSGITELTPGASGDVATRQIASAMYEVQRALATVAERLEASDSGTGSGSSAEIRQLAGGISEVLDQMRREQDVVRRWVDEQTAQQNELMRTLQNLIEEKRERL